ncbi:MAG: PadR family transcriptional regulator [Propionibacteriaceae bacterium]|nr:PadR family transcriptional regulator [Propionibacteriaceae bacterium]
MTEMLKGTLEGIVLAILSARPAYGYDITARLREQGFAEIAEGTVYALLIRVEQRGLVDVEKMPSEKGPPRKVYSLNANGRAYLEEFWETWGFLAERLEQLHEGGRWAWPRNGSNWSPARWRRRSAIGGTGPASTPCPNRTPPRRRPS